MTKGQILQKIEAIDIIKFIRRKNERIQARFLSELETILSRDSKEFPIIRKLYLDSSNGFTRAILKSIFGEVEE